MTHYVYMHVRTGSQDPFYVGAGAGKRPWVKRNRNFLWHKIVKKFGYEVIILFQGLTREQAFVKESALIHKYKLLGMVEANFSFGNERGGPVGVVRSKKTRRKMAVSKKGDLNPSKRSDVKRKMSEAKLRDPQAAERARRAFALASKKNCIKVIDDSTGVIYPSIKAAALAVNRHEQSLARYLSGRVSNRTSLRRVE